MSAVPLATGVTAGLESLAFGILNAIIFFIVFIFSHIAQSVYDYFIRNAFNPSFLFPGIGVGGITNQGVAQPAGFTSAWFYPNVHFAGQGIVNGIYKINEDILGFVAVPMIFFMIVIQVFAVFFDILEGKLPVWREWFAKITVAVVLAVLSYWIAGAVLLLGYLPFYAVWTGFTFNNAYVGGALGHSWMWSGGAVLLPQNIPGFITSGPQGVIQLIFLSVELMVIFLLWFMIVLRNAIILFLVAVLPIASILLATNWTASIGKKLWRLFVELSFLPFFVALPLWIFSTLMWQYGAWAQNSLGAYMADMGFLIFALGMPYLFLEGIGMLQGMGFPSAGQAVSLGTQTGMMLAGVGASIAVGSAKSSITGAAGGLSSARSRLGMTPSGGGAGSRGPGPGNSSGGSGNLFAAPANHIQNASLAHQMQDQVGVKLPGMFAVGRNMTQYAGSVAYLGAGLLSSMAASGVYGLYHRIKANQGSKLSALEKTDPTQHAKIMGGRGGQRANMHYQLEQAKVAHGDVADYARENWDSSEAQSHWQSVVMHGSGTLFGMQYKDGDTLSGLMSDHIRQLTTEYGLSNPGMQEHQARNFAVFNTVRDATGWAAGEAKHKGGWGGVFHVKGDASNSLPGSKQILQNHESFASGAAFNASADHLDTYWNNHRRDIQSNIDGYFTSKRTFFNRR